ncbi:MAG: DUF1344 domain-containing protein [Candidatus Rokuibacteriota bacterium]
MRAVFALVTGLAILGSAGVGSARIIAARTAPGVVGTLVAAGTVKFASPTGREFTLWDGRTFVVPRPPAFVTDELMPGAFVNAVYAVVDGRNVVTELTVHGPDVPRFGQ